MEVNTPPKQWNQPQPIYRDNKKIVAGIFALFFGSLGIHKFYLGYNNEGIIMLILTIVGFVTACIFIGFIILSVIGLVAFIEGIIYLTRSDEEFYQTYQVNKKPWF